MDSFGRLAGAYVHVPFCAQVCPYCDFAVVAGQDELAERYCEAVASEVRSDQAWKPLDTVYFGGGTPSHIAVASLSQILEALRDRHGIAEKAEVSLEANPEDFSSEKAAQLFQSGFNRVSFGAQSFDPGVLIALGRRHGPDQIAEAAAAAREAGFENVSIDLIYGTPEETDLSWRETVDGALSSSPDHLSCYALTVEPGTPLGREVRDGAPAPDPDVQANRFGNADALFGAAGYSRYEVSNWSVRGKECVYNSAVWAQGEYVAYGNGAHGFRSGYRTRNLRNLSKYLEAVEAGLRPEAGRERVFGWSREIDRLFVGLRRVVGVATGPGTDALFGDPAGARLAQAGLIVQDDDRVRITDPMLTDEVLRVVVGLEPPGKSEANDILGSTHA